MQYDNTIYNMSFENKVLARSVYDSICEHMSTTTDDFVVLPPLFMRTNEDVIVCINNKAFLFFVANGPIIPVLTGTRSLRSQSVTSDVINLYKKNSHNFISHKEIFQV